MPPSALEPFLDEPGLAPGRGRLRLTVGAGVVLVLAAAAVAVAILAFAPHGTRQTAANSGVRSAAPTGSRAPTVFVHVVGAVPRPGLYPLAAGSRTVDAIAAAGGFLPAADQAALNLAAIVSDGQQVVVPIVGAMSAAPGATASGKVNINTADATVLETLDGIGPALAARILDFRRAHGPFAKVDDLQNVAGIGGKKFDAIKDSITT